MGNYFCLPSWEPGFDSQTCARHIKIFKLKYTVKNVLQFGKMSGKGWGWWGGCPHLTKHWRVGGRFSQYKFKNHPPIIISDWDTLKVTNLKITLIYSVKNRNSHSVKATYIALTYIYIAVPTTMPFMWKGFLCVVNEVGPTTMHFMWKDFLCVFYVEGPTTMPFM